MKIIFITDGPYWNRDHHRFGLDYFEKKGYRVEIWRAVTKKSIVFETQAGMYNGDNYHEYSEKEIKKQIRRNRDALFYLRQFRKGFIFTVMSLSCRYVVFGGMGATIEFPATEEALGASAEEKKLYGLLIRVPKIINGSGKKVKKWFDQRRYMKLL